MDRLLPCCICCNSVCGLLGYSGDREVCASAVRKEIAQTQSIGLETIATLVECCCYFLFNLLYVIFLACFFKINCL